MGFYTSQYRPNFRPDLRSIGPHTPRNNNKPKIWRNFNSGYQFDKIMEDYPDLDEPLMFVYDANTNEQIGIATSAQIAASFSLDDGIILERGREIYVDE